MPDLIAVDLPGGPEFVTALMTIWERGDAVFCLDQRLPAPAREAVLTAIAPTHIYSHGGQQVRWPHGRGVEVGDALVMATSGTTGQPKGIVLTEAAVTASAVASSERLGVTSSDHWLACLPLSHVGGMSVITRALQAGTGLTVQPGFDPEAVMNSGATLVSLVSTALRRIDPTRFRKIVLGGAVPPEDLPPNVVTTYGMTETGSGVVYDGIPLTGVEIGIRPHGPETDADLGEIWVRAPMLLRCYRNGRDPNSDVDPRDPQGWFPTGDLGRFHSDGRLIVKGRAGDLIITGGENVWPESVEKVLATHPHVADVAVAGQPDPEWGHKVVAYVVPRAVTPDLQSLRDHVRSELPAFCAPREMVVVTEIPRTSLGKITRHRLPNAS
jgi:O-succinylbenzoic acid--CoA ligase